MEKPLNEQYSRNAQKTLDKERENLEEEKKKSRVSRRDFLKYSAGVAAVAAGAAATLGKIPLPTEENKARPETVPDSSEPLVVSVQGEELTVMTAQGEVKVRDASLAAAIAEKAQ